MYRHFDGCRFVSSDNIGRRLIGDDKIQVSGVVALANGINSITDIQIGLNTNLTRLTNYYTTTETNTILILKAPLASPALTGTISTTGDITCSNETATTITANKSLTIQQTGDTYGASSLTLLTRNTFYGITVQIFNSTATVTDVALQTS